MTRKIIRIDEELCNGCGICIDACAEGALVLVDGKAKLVAELYCDGLGACLGGCPTGALTIEEREADEFDESAVHALLASREAAAPPHHAGGGCPGSRAMQLARESAGTPSFAGPSQLTNWPVQIHLLSPAAPYFENADVLVAADCVPFALASFHSELLRGKTLMVGCPKLDDAMAYRDKLTTLFRERTIRSVTVAIMEVPCCNGMRAVVEQALAASGKQIPLEIVRVGIRGEVLETIAR